MPVLRKQGLTDAPELLHALDGSDVRAILAGHYHHSITAQLTGIPVFVGPSLAYHQVMHAGPNLVAGHDTPLFSLVQFTELGISNTVIELRTPPPIFAQPTAAR